VAENFVTQMLRQAKAKVFEKYSQSADADEARGRWINLKPECQ